MKEGLIGEDVLYRPNPSCLPWRGEGRVEGGGWMGKGIGVLLHGTENVLSAALQISWAKPAGLCTSFTDGTGFRKYCDFGQTF